MLNLAMVFVNVVPHRHQEDFGQDLLVTPKQELPETIIFLNNPKGTPRLDGTVHPQQNAFFACDTLQ